MCLMRRQIGAWDRHGQYQVCASPCRSWRYNAHTPPAHDARTTRKTILDTAARLLAEEGMAVSLRRIMSTANVNIAAIHYHFGERQALIDAAVLASSRATRGD